MSNLVSQGRFGTCVEIAHENVLGALLNFLENLVNAIYESLQFFFTQRLLFKGRVWNTRQWTGNGHYSVLTNLSIHFLQKAAVFSLKQVVFVFEVKCVRVAVNGGNKAVVVTCVGDLGHWRITKIHFDDGFRPRQLVPRRVVMNLLVHI